MHKTYLKKTPICAKTTYKNQTLSAVFAAVQDGSRDGVFSLVIGLASPAKWRTNGRLDHLTAVVEGVDHGGRGYVPETIHPLGARPILA